MQSNADIAYRPPCYMIALFRIWIMDVDDELT